MFFPQVTLIIAVTEQNYLGVVQRQGIKNTISSYLGIVLGFVSLIIIQPKFLQPEEIGLARVLFAFSTLVASIIPLGVTNVTIKYFPFFKNEKQGHHGFLGYVLLFTLVGFLITAAVLFAFKSYFVTQYVQESPLFTEYYNYIFPFSLFLAFATVVTTYLTSLYKTTVPSYLNDIYTRAAYILLVVVYYFGYISLPQFVIGYVGIYGLQLLLLLLYLTKEDSPSLVIEWNFFQQQGLKEMVSFGLLLSLSTMAALGLKTLDSIILSKYSGLHVVGIYTIAAFIPTIIETPLNALDRVIIARVAHAVAEKDNDALRDAYYKSVKYLSVIGGLLFVGINCNILYLMNMIGKGYEQGTMVVWIISIGSLINMLAGSNNAILIYAMKQWQAVVFMLSLVVVSFLVNVFMIPRFGMLGAAYSSAITAFLFAAIKLLMINRTYGLQPYNLHTIKVLLIILFCLGLDYMLPVFTSDIANLLLHGSVVGTAFLVLVYALKLLPELHRYLPWEKR